MATIRKRKGKKGTSFQVQVRVKGGGLETATFENLTKAKLWAQTIEAAIRDGRYFTGSASKKYTLQDLINKFLEHPSLKQKTRKVYEPQLKWWASNLGDTVLADITPDIISRTRGKLLQKGIKS